MNVSLPAHPHVRHIFPVAVMDEDDQIAKLDDATLFQEIHKLLPDAGPVVDSTRRLYRKMLRRSMGLPSVPFAAEKSSASPPSIVHQEPVVNEEEGFEVLDAGEEPGATSSPQRGGRSSRGRLSTPSVSSEAASPRPEEQSGLKQRHNRRVSFDDNVEWVQNDPEEQPASLSFFVKAVLIGAFLCFILTLSIIAWTDSMQEQEDPVFQIPAPASSQDTHPQGNN